LSQLNDKEEWAGEEKKENGGLADQKNAEKEGKGTGQSGC